MVLFYQEHVTIPNTTANYDMVQTISTTIFCASGSRRGGLTCQLFKDIHGSQPILQILCGLGGLLDHVYKVDHAFDGRNSAVLAAMQAQYPMVMVKTELNTKVKLFFYQSVFNSTIPYVLELWVNQFIWHGCSSYHQRQCKEC